MRHDYNDRLDSEFPPRAISLSLPRQDGSGRCFRFELMLQQFVGRFVSLLLKSLESFRRENARVCEVFPGSMPAMPGARLNFLRTHRVNGGRVPLHCATSAIQIPRERAFRADRKKRYRVTTLDCCIRGFYLFVRTIGAHRGACIRIARIIHRAACATYVYIVYAP